MNQPTSEAKASDRSIALKSHRRDWSALANVLVLVFAIVAVALFFRAKNEHFLNPAHLTSLINDFPILAVPVVAMTLLLVIGAIDLSIGSVMALSAAVIGYLMSQGHGPFVAVSAGLLTGTACGCINGGLTLSLRIPSFIATLGMLEFARGSAGWLLNLKTVFIGSEIGGVYQSLASLRVSSAFLIAIVLAIVGQLVLSQTVFGRTLIAIGTNEQAARLAGLRTRLPQLLVFAFAGFSAAIAGWFLTSSMQSCDPNAAIGAELTVIAAVVIGGTSLMGGKGSIVASLLGLILMQVLQSGLQTVGASEPEKRMTVGCVIVIAVAADAIRRAISTHGTKWLHRILPRK